MIRLVMRAHNNKDSVHAQNAPLIAAGGASMRNVKTPRFSARHYDYIADWIKRHSFNADERFEMAAFLIPAFKADNPKFNRDTFLKACGLEDEK